MALSTHPFAYDSKLDLIGHDSNIGNSERIATGVAGVALMSYFLFRRSWISSACLTLGAIILQRAAKGECAVYRHFGKDTSSPRRHRGVRDGQGLKLEQTIEIERTPTEVYSYWRQLSNLPKFMPHLVSVEEIDDRISHWCVEGPAGRKVEWDAEIISQHPGEMIAWQTLPGAIVQSAGSVRFAPMAAGSSTKVTVLLEYHPPGGRLGALAAGFLGDSPESQLTEDLGRFKKLLESDEIRHESAPI